jgi:ribonuclease T2
MFMRNDSEVTMGRVRAALLMLVIVLGTLGVSALHAAPACDVPRTLPVLRDEGASDREPKRLLPIGGYTLSLIWLPQQCRAKGDGFRCGDANRAGFVLHGLWPDGKGKDWPQWCRPSRPLPATTLKAHYCTTPNPQLIQHEWAKHGTCMDGYTPDRYLALSGRLFDGFVQPRLRPLSRSPQTARSIQRAVAAANPGLTADMMRLYVSRDGWLQEVWLCLDTRFKPRPCAAHQGGAKPNDRVQIWRGGRDRARRG